MIICVHGVSRPSCSSCKEIVTSTSSTRKRKHDVDLSAVATPADAGSGINTDSAVADGAES